MPEATTIYFVRHAHADWRNDDDRALSANGSKAALVVANQLATRPIVAIYTSPSRRSVETVEPLATRLGLSLHVIADLRERTLPVVPPDQFEGLVRRAWSFPSEAPNGGESNVQAQARSVAIVQSLLMRHAGAHVVLATHGNLLALALNAFDAQFGYEFWHRLSFPDIYQLVFDGSELRNVTRLWR